MSHFLPPHCCEERGHPHHVSTVVTPDGLVAFAGSAPEEFVRAVLRESYAAWCRVLKGAA